MLKLPRFKRSMKFITLSVVTALSIATSACAFSLADILPFNLISQAEHFNPVTVTEIAEANIQGTSSHPHINGRLVLVETPNGLKLSGQIRNAPPGMHGFHIHEGSSCAEDGMAAGGHFNPGGTAHGHLMTQGFGQAHAGDLGNLAVAADGQANVDQTIAGLTMKEGQYAIAGRTIILHASPDDFSQPTGNAGARIACSVITPMVSVTLD